MLYLVDRDGQKKLHIAFTETEENILDGSAGASGPFFSSDSWIAFVANGTLKKVPISGLADQLDKGIGNTSCNS